MGLSKFCSLQKTWILLQVLVVRPLYLCGVRRHSLRLISILNKETCYTLANVQTYVLDITNCINCSFLPPTYIAKKDNNLKFALFTKTVKVRNKHVMIKANVIYMCICIYVLVTDNAILGTMYMLICNYR